MTFKIAIKTKDDIFYNLLEDILLKNQFIVDDIDSHILYDNGETLSFIVNENEEHRFEKPVSIGALLHILNKYHFDENKPIDIGGCTLNIKERILYNKENTSIKIPLREKEVDIIIYLVKNNGDASKRKDLLKNIWGYSSAIETKTLETHIYRLRKKIEKVIGKNDLLIAEDGAYRFNIKS